MPLGWKSSCRTDVGKVRNLNEDAFLEMSNIGLWLVADGMGGHSAGDVASGIVVDAFNDLIQPGTLGELSYVVQSKLGIANRAILNEADARPGNVVMGSTVVALIAQGNECCCLWAGDSRAYLMRDGEFSQLTRDHSVVEGLIESGELRREDAADHPEANVITRAVGVEPQLKLEEQCYVLREQDKILLCSDGLDKELSDDDIAQILARHDCQTAADMLIDMTLERGARDNVTVAVIEFYAEDDITVPVENSAMGQ